MYKHDQKAVLLPLVLVEGFFKKIRDKKVDIYNEISLQHELGIYLRQILPDQYKIYFERPVSDFGLNTQDFIKKEIDIVIFTADHKEKTAIELKYPRNGQYPEQMFKFCQDICFLEQLVSKGFSSGLFICVVDDPLFYQSRQTRGIYRHFTKQEPLSGVISKPTGAKNLTVTLYGTYVIEWVPVMDELKYFVIRINL